MLAYKRLPFLSAAFATLLAISLCQKLPKAKPDRILVHVLNATDYVIDKSFLSFALGTRIFKRQAKFLCPYTDPRMITMMKALGPGTVRIGGSASDYVYIDPENRNLKQSDFRFYAERRELEEIGTFLHKVGWDLLFGLGISQWLDPKIGRLNINMFLQYFNDNLDHVPRRYLQIGNEINIHKSLNVTPEEFAKVTKDFKDKVLTYSNLKHIRIVGPDLTVITRGKQARRYLDGFADAGGLNIVDIVGQHHYYIGKGKATIRDLTDPRFLFKFNILAFTLRALVDDRDGPHKPIWLTETASFFGGGKNGLSDVFGAGFLWLDKLGVSAKEGISKVCRQVVCGGADYAMVKPDLFPLPDYWISLLYKQLVGEGSVFKVEFTPKTELLRVYAHCADAGLGHPPGAVVVYYLNLKEELVKLNFPDWSRQRFEYFVLTPGDDNGLLSNLTKLNNRLLKLTKKGELPKLRGKARQPGSTFFCPGKSYGFLVFPDAGRMECQRFIKP